MALNEQMADSCIHHMPTGTRMLQISGTRQQDSEVTGNLSTTYPSIRYFVRIIYEEKLSLGSK